MRFTPKSEEEMNPLLPPGDYDAEVIKAEETVSSKGNDMIKLTLCLYDTDGAKVFITDYLLEAMLKKLKHFCDSAGLAEVYARGELTAEACRGATVIVKIKQKIDETGQYPPKNEVDDYLTKKGLPKMPPAPMGSQMSSGQLAEANRSLGDDVPF